MIGKEFASMKINAIIKATVTIFMVAAIILIIKLQFDANSLEAERNELQSEISQAEEKLAELQNHLNSPFNEDYIIEIARKKLNMRLPEEIVFYNDLLK